MHGLVSAIWVWLTALGRGNCIAKGGRRAFSQSLILQSEVRDFHSFSLLYSVHVPASYSLVYMLICNILQMHEFYV